MYVCICNAVTDTQIREAADAGVRNIKDLEKTLGVASSCGSCKETATEILREARAESRPPAQPLMYQPATA